MSQIHWLNPVSGYFTTPADWSGHTVPGAADDAILDAAGSAFTVTAPGSETVNGVQLAANATLAITGGTFTATNGTDGGVNSGTIKLGDANLYVDQGLVNGAGGIIDVIGGRYRGHLNSPQGPIINDGTLEATGFAFYMSTPAIENGPGGVIFADNAFIFMNGVTSITGGTIVTTGRYGEVDVDGNGGDFTLSGVTVAGRLEVLNEKAFTVGGILQNSGYISVFSLLDITGAGLTLSGAGTIALSGHYHVTAIDGPATLDNVGNTIEGGGFLSGGRLSLVNQAVGIIDADTSHGLVLGVSGHAIVNAGTLEATVSLHDGAGVLTVEGALDNTGLLAADGGTIIVMRAVTGAGGAAEIDGGTLDFMSSFNQNITFGATGAVELAQSQDYTHSIVDFSAGGGTSLDLADIAFVGAGEARFAGSMNGGVLTVTDGTHTARIRLAGDFLGNDFVAVADGHGGTMVVDHDHWARAVSGDFTTASDWTGRIAPATIGVAYLDATGKAYTVTASASETVGGVVTGGNTTLVIAAGTTFTAIGGTAGGGSAGAIVVQTNAALAAGGEMDNTGAIQLDGATISVLEGGLTLGGGGTVTLGGGTGDSIVGATATATTLVNTDNTIVGAGFIGDSNFHDRQFNPLRVVNGTGAVIDATGALYIESGTGSNAGLIEAIDGGDLTILFTSIDNNGGEIFAGAGSTVTLQRSDAVGGTVATAAGGTIVLKASGLELGGTIDNAGAIRVGVQGIFLTADTSLTGSGTISLLAGARSRIDGSFEESVLTNVDNTIVGAGDVSAGSLINQVAGVIDADGHQNPLTIESETATIVNAGLIESTGAGGGLVRSPLANAGILKAASGTLTLVGAVSGSGSAIISGGVLVFVSSFEENVGFTGTTGELELAQSQAYAGQVSGFSTAGATSLDLHDIGFVSAGEATFSGTATSGVLTVSDGTHIAAINLQGDYLGATFTASSDGVGGTIVVASTSAPTLPSALPLIAAMAGMARAPGLVAISGGDHIAAHTPALARPGTVMA